MPRRWLLVAVSVLLTVVAAACDDRAGGKPPTGEVPTSMAALGDSITAGLGACLGLFVCPRYSWSTGDGIRVDSHFRRIRTANKAIDGHAYNLADAGARSADLAAQAATAVSRKVTYVTVLIGANDICRAPDADSMTSAKTFRANVDKALGALRKGLPQARVLVVSVPNLYHVWEIGHTNARAVRIWGHGVCPVLLANPTSDAETDVARRALVRERVGSYNRELAGACKAYGPRCRADGGAAFAVNFPVTMLNPLDYFHPDASGQDKLAEVTFPERFSW